MFLTYNPGTDRRLANDSALISVCDDGSEVRANLDLGVAPISNDFVMIGQTPTVMIDDINTIEQGEVVFFHTGLYVEGGGYIDYDTIQDDCVFTTNMQTRQNIHHYGKKSNDVWLVLFAYL